eukprot:3561245-Pyramimonas_sp.AAC.1
MSKSVDASALPMYHELHARARFSPKRKYAYVRGVLQASFCSVTTRALLAVNKCCALSVDNCQTSGCTFTYDVLRTSARPYKH